MQQQDKEIACPICRKANADFERLTRRINEVRTPGDKAPHARVLVAKVEAVVREHGDATDDPVSQACLSVLGLRKQAAELILNAEKLGR